MNKAKSVWEYTEYINRLFKYDEMLSSVFIMGEISNCKYHSSGHIYFTLKDDRSAIPTVMFRGNRENGLAFELKDGQKVVITGEISIYEKDGKYQLYARRIQLDGIGRFFEELELLKKKFAAEGLFEKSHKKPLPRFPKRIGIVTASTGAAIQDILSTAKRRNPFVELILYPAKVQGKGAAETIVKGIRRLEREGVDIIIIGRGGGSIEDLWCFNEEIVARAVYACKTPIISAVGHEVDFTISDFVADFRAATPTAAAEHSVPEIQSILSELLGFEEGIRYKMKEKLRFYGSILEKLELKLMKESPGAKLRQFVQRADEAEDSFRQIMERKILIYRNKISSLRLTLSHRMKLNLEKTNRNFLVLAAKLEGFSPIARLTAGYSYVETEEGKNLRSVKKIKINESIRISVSDGTIKARVEEIIYGGAENECGRGNETIG